MHAVTKALLIVSGVAIAAAYAMSEAKAEPLTTVPRVDLARYMGRWYEIARYPNRFQRKCAGDTTATYTLLPEGKVEVVNSCRKQDGETNTAKGKAKVADKQSNAKLKVTFFWPFSGDYWVIDLGPNYEYAVVGEPSRKYLWILSRTPQMDSALYGEIVSRIAARGYDTSKLMKTLQTAH